MRKHMLFVISLVLCLCLAIPGGALAERVQMGKEPPMEVQATSAEDFFGIWKAAYVEINGEWYDYDQATGNVEAWFFLFEQHMFVAIGNMFGYAEYLGFDDGILEMYDRDGGYELALAEDGSAYLMTNGMNLILERQEEILFEEVAYAPLAQNPEAYIGKFARFSGTVEQVMGSRAADDFYQIRLAVDGEPDQLVYAEFERIPSMDLSRGDHVTVFVLLGGEYAYETIEGSYLTVPLAFIIYCALNG